MRKCLMLASLIPALMGGCPPPEPTDGIDLSVRGELFLKISRPLGRASADVTAHVIDREAGFLIFQVLELSRTQVLGVDGTALEHRFLDLPGWVSATVMVLAPPNAHSITFSNDGEIRDMLVTAVNETSITAPSAGETVSSSGFTLLWSPSAEPGVLVTVSIEGDVPDPERAGSTMRSIETLSDRPDSGTLSIGSQELAKYLPGTIEVKLARHRTANQALGFRGGVVIVEASDRLAFSLGT